MTDDQYLLASAYLDGALTSEEQARAEAEPDVMAAVEQLREIRRSLASVEPTDPARRDAAIDAALAVFDDEGADATPPAPVLSLRRRRREGWLGAAAAALVVLAVGGIIALGVRGGGDDDDAGGDDGATAAATTMIEHDQPARGGDDEGAERSAGTAPADTTAAGALEEQGTFAAETTGDAAATTGAPDATNASTEATQTTAPTRFVLSSPEELTAFAAEREDEDGRLQAESTAPTARPCDSGRLLGQATYRRQRTKTPVDIYFDAQAGEVRAVDPETCEIVLTAPAP